MSRKYMERPSDSPFVHYFEWGLAEAEGVRVFPADSHWYMFVQRQNGEVRLGVSGPMTQVIHVPHPAGTECFGIRFALGTFISRLSAGNLVNNVMFLPEAA